MTLYGYARVSVREPEDKNLDLQVERLVRAGCSLGNIRAEEASGAGTTAAAFWNCWTWWSPTLTGSPGADPRAAGDRGPAPGGSGVPVSVRGF